MSAARRDWRDVLSDLERCARDQADQAADGEATTVGCGPEIMKEAAALLLILGPSMEEGERPARPDASHLEWANQRDLVDYVRGCCSRAEYECEKLTLQRADRRRQLALNIRQEIARIRFAIGYADPDVEL